MPNIELPPGFPARLHTLRVARYLTETELADRAGLTYKTIREIENGKRDRSYENTLLSLAAALDLSIDELLGLESPEDEKGKMAADLPEGECSRFRFWKKSLIAAVIMLMAWVVIFGITFGYGYSHAVVRAEGNLLTAKDGVFGIGLWEKQNNAPWTFSRIAPWDKSLMLVGSDSKTFGGGQLMCLARATGDTLWSAGPDIDAVVRAFGPDLVEKANFTCDQLQFGDLEGAGKVDLLVRFSHGKYFPCCLCRIDQGGVPISQYVNKGHIRSFFAKDLDGDGKAEVVAWGTNNGPAIEGFSVILLDEDHWSGAAIGCLDDGGSRVQDNSLARLVVPNFPDPYMNLMGGARLMVDDLSIYYDSAGVVHFTARVGGVSPNFIDIVLDEGLRPVSAAPTDGFVAIMRSSWPDSLTNGTGPGNREWLDCWLGRGQVYSLGQPVRGEEPYANGFRQNRSTRLN